MGRFGRWLVGRRLLDRGGLGGCRLGGCCFDGGRRAGRCLLWRLRCRLRGGGCYRGCVSCLCRRLRLWRRRFLGTEQASEEAWLLLTRRVGRLGLRLGRRLVACLVLVGRAAEQVAEEIALALGRCRTCCGCRGSRHGLDRVERLAGQQVLHLAGSPLTAAQCAFKGAWVQGIGVLTGKRYALHRALPKTPVLADLARSIGQVGTPSAGIGAVALDFITGEGAAGLRVEGVQANEHLVDHLLVAKGLQQAGVVAGKVDHHIGTALEGRLDPQHAQAGIAEDLARHARPAFPDRFLELEHHLVAPAVVGALERRHMLVIQARRHLDLGQCAQGHGHHHVIGAVTHTADFHGDAVLVLNDCTHRRVGLDGLQLLDERLRQHRAAAGQPRCTQVTVAHVTVDAVLLGEIQQRQARWLVVAAADLLVDQLAGGGRQLQLVQPGGHVDLVQGEQGAGRLGVERIVDRTGQIVQGFLVALEGFGRGRLLEGQVCGAEILAIDQVARGAHEFGCRQRVELEAINVLVEYRLRLGIADPFAGGQARAAAHACLGFEQGHLPALVLQLIGCGQACHAAAHDDGRGRLVTRQRGPAGNTNQYQRAQAHPSSSHVGELRVKGCRKTERGGMPRERR